MPFPIIIFSRDKLRGGITHKVLKRTGFESLLVDRVLEAGDVIADNAPRVIIFDAKGVFPAELNLLRNLCRALRDIAIIVIGDRSIVDTFGGEAVQNCCCLADPFDPELIASKVKKILSLKAKGKRLQGDGLESDLKQFLKLG